LLRLPGAAPPVGDHELELVAADLVHVQAGCPQVVDPRLVAAEALDEIGQTGEAAARAGEGEDAAQVHRLDLAPGLLQPTGDLGDQHHAEPAVAVQGDGALDAVDDLLDAAVGDLVQRAGLLAQL